MTDPAQCRTLAEYDAWCRAHMVEFNRLAVTDPAEWERVATRIDVMFFDQSKRRTET